ncbi:MAG: flagellar biosynthesis protein FlhF [Candidatus Latescibacteria bacterium]|jgi:flagellar biosynthesis protein FlhF|nr:flagellar biosynthesis protein FlhF [Candidatus Latescibacterota bacterium]
MIIKKFTAPTMTEALAKVREHLGADAIILNTRSEKRGGVFDFMGRKLVEVTAAIDDNELKRRGDVSRTSRPAPAPVNPAEAKLYPPQPPVVYESNKAGLAGKSLNVEIKDIEKSVNIEKLFGDINELKRSIKTLADSALSGEMAGLPPNLASLLTSMQASGMDDSIAKRLVRQLLDELKGKELIDPSTVLRKAADMLLVGISDVSPIVFTGAKPRMVAFVGPTGSGKTTTIAKLAADFTLNMNKDVSVLTIDTRRVDAIGQLKAYCRILNIPLNIAYTPEELPAIMPGIMKSDITLVDTPGSGPMDKQHMLDMVEFLQKMVPQEVHLVMSVTTSIGEMNRILDNFSVMKPNRILFTKLDETNCYGPLLSFAIKAKQPMSYVTYGQTVPGDFSQANPEKLIEQSINREIEITE